MKIGTHFKGGLAMEQQSNSSSSKEIPSEVENERSVAATQPAVQQDASKPAEVKPEVVKPAVKPAVKKPAAAKPVLKKPAAVKPAAKTQAAAKPAAKKPAAKPASKPAAKSAKKPTTSASQNASSASETAAKTNKSSSSGSTAKGGFAKGGSSGSTAKGGTAKGGSSSLAKGGALKGSQAGAGTAPPKKRRRPKRVVSNKPIAIGRRGFTKLKNISEIRHFLRLSEQPVFFVGATAFNLLGLDRWVRGFSYIAYFDSWDGAHPRVFTPMHKPYVEFQSGEEINNWLLKNHEVRAHIARNTPPGMRPQVLMVFFDAETERICDELDYELILPSHAIREYLDSKIVTTQIADSVDVPSVPNIITEVSNWTELQAAAKKANLGRDLVIQTAYGDSGKTTYFVKTKSDFERIAQDITDVEIKIMKRINNRPIAIEAVVTRHGTIVGPCMTEITGHPELTPYRGGWAGNEMFPAVLDDEHRHTANMMVRKLGDRLVEEGYSGFFEVDVLLDTDTGELYLGELNPRISGASAITNVTAGAYADVPLFAFHLLEYSGIDFEIDIDELNQRWEDLAAEDEWSHIVIKHTLDTMEFINSAPPTGRYVIDHFGRMVYSNLNLDWHSLRNESESYFLRIASTGDYRWKGSDLGILLTKSHLETEDGALSLHAKYLSDSIRSMYNTTVVESADSWNPS